MAIASLDRPQGTRDRRKRSSRERIDPEKRSLNELLMETRILLPGTEVFLAFLMTLPFSGRFDGLSVAQRTVYLCTFLATVLAMTCFVVPASYHRIARPIHHKERFKLLANAFLVAGLVPVSIAVVLVTYLVTSVVFPGAALAAAGGVGLLIGGVWWGLPLLRAHDRFIDRDA
jgi:archaellum biogenesis protein FlaJ (TadC family)